MTTPEPFPLHKTHGMKHGDIIKGWCSNHAEPHSVRRIYLPDRFPWLICLECHPELDPEKKEVEQ
jgi:hypothetical protein